MKDATTLENFILSMNKTLQVLRKVSDSVSFNEIYEKYNLKIIMKITVKTLNTQYTMKINPVTLSNELFIYVIDH